MRTPEALTLPTARGPPSHRDYGGACPRVQNRSGWAYCGRTGVARPGHGGCWQWGCARHLGLSVCVTKCVGLPRQRGRCRRSMNDYTISLLHGRHGLGYLEMSDNSPSVARSGRTAVLPSMSTLLASVVPLTLCLQQQRACGPKNLCARRLAGTIKSCPSSRAGTDDVCGRLHNVYRS